MKPEYTFNEALSIREDEITPDPNPAWRRALTAYTGLTDAYLAHPDEDVLRRIWNHQDQLDSLLMLSGKFPLGRLLMTLGARDAMQEQFHAPVEFLIRHRHGDWGDLDRHDQGVNEEALRKGQRLLSSYPMRHEGRIWAITEADRSSSCLVLPSEY